MSCPACGSTEHVELGHLGHLRWVRCECCGIDFNIDTDYNPGYSIIEDGPSNEAIRSWS
jgi:transposase-like protein